LGAFIWVPDDVFNLNIGMNPIGTPFNDAWGINDSEDIDVVGTRTFLDSCSTEPCCSLGNRSIHRAFRWDADSEAVVDLDPAGDFTDESSSGYDINTAGTLTSAGQSGPCSISGVCGQRYRADGWLGTSPTELSLTGITDAEEAESRGVNDSASLVGWIHVDTDPPNLSCARTASFWLDSSEDPFDLGAAAIDQEVLEEGDQTEAWGINDADPVQIVGHKISTGPPLLWTDDGNGGWDTINLNDVINTCADFELQLAYDVNDSGWIVGVGINGSSQVRGYVLSPVNPSCYADTDNDGEVEIDDYSAVMSQWGACQVGRICTADVNFTCTVNIDDYTEVILYWGPCGGSLQGGYSPEDQALLLELMLEFLEEHPEHEEEVLELIGHVLS